MKRNTRTLSRSQPVRVPHPLHRPHAGHLVRLVVLILGAMKAGTTALYEAYRVLFERGRAGALVGFDVPLNDDDDGEGADAGKA